MTVAFLEVLWETSVCNGMVWPSGSRWLSWLRPINVATVGEQRVLTATRGHLAASVVGNTGRETLLVSPFRRVLVYGCGVMSCQAY